MRDINKYELTGNYDEVFESNKWLSEIPVINFPTDWNVKIIPPFGLATVRFRVITQNVEISIYLDCYNLLGVTDGNPYWEVYPYEDDVFRCGMNEVDLLINAINKTIKEYN